jgi:ribose-phosphate pyrophosphokinase
MNTPRPIHFIVTEDRVELVNAIKEKLQILLWDRPVESQVLPYKYFKDSSPNEEFPESVRWKHVYIISDVFSNAENNENYDSSVNDRYEYSRWFQKIAQNSKAKTINVIFPAFPYARDDKFDHMWCSAHMKRTANRASIVIEDSLNRGLSYVITHDIHNLATFAVPRFGGMNTSFISLAYGRTIQEVIKRTWIKQKNTILSGTDQWATKKIEAVCKDLHINYLEASKKRDYTKPQSVSKIKVYGSVNKKDVILYDDILDTGWTLITCLKEIWNKKGKPNSVNLLISHGLFNGNSLEQVLEAHKAWLFNKLYITNSVLRTQLETFFEEHNYPSFIETIDLSTIFAHTIASIVQEKDINYNNNTPILATV